jgi:ABC-type glycerol-3-phosphate transport system substrate-binding protein
MDEDADRRSFHTKGTTRRTTLRIAAAAGASAALAGCASGAPGGSGAAGSGDGNKVQGKVEYWFSVGAEREPVIAEMIRSFQTAQPSIQVEPWSAPSDTAMADKVVAAIAAGTPPDVGFLNAPLLASVAAAGLADVAPLAKKDKAFQLTEIFEPVGLDMARYWSMQGPGGEKLYALPYGTGLIHLYFNRDAFAEVGLAEPAALYDKGQWNWAAAVTAAQKLTKRGGTAADRYGYAVDFDVLRTIGFVPQNNGRLFDEKTRKFVLADEPAVIETVQWLLDFKDRYGAAQPTPPPQGEPTNRQQLFQTGKAAMFHGFNTYLAAMKNTIGSSFRYGVAPLATGKKEAAYANGSLVSMMRGAKNPDAAWAFTKHTVGAQAYEIYVRGGLITMPALKDKKAKEAFLQSGPYGAAQLLKHSLTGVTDPFVTPAIGDIRAAFNEQASAIWNGQIGLRAGLTLAQQKMQALYDSSAPK